MNSLKVLSIAAAMSLALAAPTVSFAQTKWSGPGGGGVAVGGGGGGGGVAIGGGYRGGYGGGHRHHHHGGFGGFGAGLAFGSALASQSYGYYGAPYGYYDDSYYDEGVVAVVPGGGDVEYCRQRYRSYDVRTGTYLGYDGLRHSCP